MSNKVVAAANASLVIGIAMSLVAALVIDTINISSVETGKLAFMFFIAALAASLWVTREALSANKSATSKPTQPRDYSKNKPNLDSPSHPVDDYSSNTSSASLSNSGRQKGAVKWFNANKGYGFILQDNGDELFVHYRSIRGSGHRTLNEGDTVEFVITQGRKGPQADDLLITS